MQSCGQALFHLGLEFGPGFPAGLGGKKNKSARRPPDRPESCLGIHQVRNVAGRQDSPALNQGQMQARDMSLRVGLGQIYASCQAGPLVMREALVKMPCW